MCATQKFINSVNHRRASITVRYGCFVYDENPIPTNAMRNIFRRHVNRTGLEELIFDSKTMVRQLWLSMDAFKLSLVVQIPNG
jgi:hypothetical protein